MLQPIELDINDAVRRIVLLLERLLGEDIALGVELSALPLFVRADASMIEQVILNLAVNARDAMPNGGTLRVRTSTETIGAAAAIAGSTARVGTFVRLTMSDTGCGIAPEHLSHIFEPFFTTKDLERAAGLGLATVYGVVNTARRLDHGSE